MSDFFSQSQNFMGALQTGVDPRTGTFSLNIAIANLTGNYGMGPEFNFTLNSNSLNRNDIGFGFGFTLPITTYDRKNKLLSLSTGAKYLVDDTPVIFEVKQKKLNDFVFERLDDCYKVIYKSGVVEVLDGPSSGWDIKNTVRIENENDCHINFKWIFKGFNRLSEVSDKYNVLLKVDYNDIIAPVITVYPESKEEYKIRVSLFNNHLKNITQLTENYTWFLDYNENGLIKYIKHPTGLIETVDYQQNIIHFPEDIYPPLMAAVRHTQSPHGGQPDIVFSYSYTTTNYLGFASGLNFKSNTDNLYSVLNDYSYGSTETQKRDDLVVETQRTYNNFHLLTNELTTYLSAGEKNSVSAEFTYYAISGIAFDNQPKQFQLVKQKKITWCNTKNQTRQEVYQSEFDQYGNPLSELEPNGTYTTMSWYSAQGELGCPAEKNGFVRFMKEKIVTPRQTEYQTPIISTQYTYSYLGNTNTIIPRQELRYADDSLLQSRNFVFAHILNTIEYGRMTSLQDTLYQDGEHSQSFRSQQKYSTTLHSDNLVLQENFIGHDGCEAKTQKTLSALTLLLLNQTNVSGIMTTYAYDSLGRILMQSAAAGTKYVNTYTWRYEMTSDGPMTHETDAVGNQMKNFFDGLGRHIRQFKFDIDDSKDWYEVASQSYDSLGEIKIKTVRDIQTTDGSDNDSSLQTITHYDDWGEMDALLFSNGLTAHEKKDPVLLTEIRNQTGISAGLMLVSGEIKTTRDDKNYLVKLEQQLDNQGREVSSRHYFWDGLGRLRKEIDELGNITERTYDVYDRILTQKLSDGTLVTQTYVPYLLGKEIASISVTSADSHHRLLGKQEFDSLGRLIKQESGGRITIYQYQEASASPKSIILPSGEQVNYKYISELGNAVSQSQVYNITQEFHYSSTTGQLLESSENNVKNNNIWNESGRLKEEVMVLSGSNKKANYRWTLAGQAVSYTDVTGALTRCKRDQHGRVINIYDKDISVDYTYDALGRLISQAVTDSAAARKLITDFNYDEFDREVTKTITDSDDIQLVVQKTWLKNGLLDAQITKQNGKLIKHENYQYDTRNRLVSYQVDGSELPVDGYGHKIIEQNYCYDALNNLTQVDTRLANHDVDTAQYYYGNEYDPTQLTAVSHSHRDYPTMFYLKYDTSGRMIIDQSGSVLQYDALDRLISIAGKENGEYHYSALNQLVNQRINNSSNHQLYYRGNELVNEVIPEKNQNIRLLKMGHDCLAVSDNTGVTLTASGHNSSLLRSHKNDQREGEVHGWTPYGQGNASESLPNFNGERVDPLSSVYHLGNGYRSYNPILMRFSSPDSLSPFGMGGINPYAYCVGDPINRIDPSGHLSGQGITGITLGVLGIGLSVFTFGASVAAAGAIMASISLTLSLASTATGIASIVLEDSKPKTSAILGWTSLALGIASMGTGMYRPVSGSYNVSSAKPSTVKNTTSCFKFSQVTDNHPKKLKISSEASVLRFDKFDLYQSKGTPQRLIITAHGVESLTGNNIVLNAGQEMRYFSNSGFSLRDPGLFSSINDLLVPRDVIKGSTKIRNYYLGNYPKDNARSILQQVTNTENTGVISILKNTDLKHVLNTLGDNNINYQQIDGIFCRTTFFDGVLSNLNIKSAPAQYAQRVGAF